jgi:hypothetical protein
MARYTFHILDGSGAQVALETRDCRIERQALSVLPGVLAEHEAAAQVDVWREDEALFRYSRTPIAPIGRAKDARDTKRIASAT